MGNTPADAPCLSGLEELREIDGSLRSVPSSCRPSREAIMEGGVGGGGPTLPSSPNHTTLRSPYICAKLTNLSKYQGNKDTTVPR